jgi:hypothetical protein
MINKTFTSKTISWANSKVSNMYPVSIVKSVFSPLATNMSMSATDPLVSIPGATLAPWNGTLLHAIKIQLESTLSQLQSYAQTQILNGNTEFYTEMAFMDNFRCSAAKATTSLIEIIVDDANTRLMSNPVTTKYPKLTVSGADSTLEYSSDSKTIGDLNIVTFTAVYTDDLYSLNFAIGFSKKEVTSTLTNSTRPVPAPVTTDGTLDY